MSILPYVITLIMIITSLTYSRLYSFRTHTGISHGFDWFLQVGERKSLNRAMEEKYDALIVQGGGGDQGGEQAKATAKLNLRILFNPKQQEKEPERYEVYTQLVHQLIHDLYKDNPHFQKLEQEHPNYLEQLFQALSHEKIDKTHQLDNVKLNDPFLQDILYKLMKQQSYGASLRDFITVYHYDDIRVFLAPPEVLQAIFQDPWAVTTIDQERLELFRNVSRKNSPLSVEQASKQLDALVKRFPTSASPYLNTQVSKTDPKKYY